VAVSRTHHPADAVIPGRDGEPVARIFGTQEGDGWYGRGHRQAQEPPAVRRWRKNLRDAGASVGTMAKAYRLLHAVLNTAVEDGSIRTNPCNIKGAGTYESDERPVATLAQVFELAEAIQPRYRLAVLLATFASLRYGEIIGLQRRHRLVEDGRGPDRRGSAEPA
jgi:integrase